MLVKPSKAGTVVDVCSGDTDCLLTYGDGHTSVMVLACEHFPLENKSRSRHNVEGSFLCVLYFGWPNQPSSGIMIILHWYVIFMLHVV